MTEDRSWMYTGRRKRGEYTQEWMDKTTDFVNWAFARNTRSIGVLCPCGRCSHTRWKKKVEKIKKRPVSDVEAYTAGRTGNQEGTYCNPRVASNIEAYTEAAKEIHGPEFDAMNAPLDNVAVYKAGRGKKHGRYLIADGFINTHSTMSEVQASGCQSQNERPQRCQQSYPRSGLPQQEIEARKILEEKLDNQTETINCLKEGYAALASIIQTHLNIPIPTLVLPPQNGSSHQGTSGGSNMDPANSCAAREVGEVEVTANEAHIDQSALNQANST